MSKEVDYIDL